MKNGEERGERQQTDRVEVKREARREPCQSANLGVLALAILVG